ncbi:hypothetical protein BFW38_02005 [Terasakiispira papahanaumokuakeensis]|uniref:RDD domain-containing protein n=1 Tax=Terasakiispira papahanaumokuakeensis TaxID=197479 RepID=A0A1E2VDR4_9GAMM|nr:RDD family protein [Terasakiispira papahanaumokuakeensis]ODC05121.1 hypothetical protein BFW38_02005 [Terasakiispira papahanaumokuakeensis]
MSEFIDNQCCVETPEGIDFVQSAAGPVPRILAYLIDLGWRLLVYLVLSIATAFIGGLGTGFLLIVTFLLEWFYPVYFEVYRQGQTPGKRVMQLCVVNTDFTPITFAPSLIRNLLRWADFLPLFYLAGLLSMVLSDRFQRLGDLAAGTLVIYRDQALRQARMVDEPIQPLAPAVPLTRDERQGIALLMQRADQVSESRQVELANWLEPITGDRGEAGLRKLKRIGYWLLGAK